MIQNCLVLITHKMDEGMLKYLSFLNREVSGIMDFVILYDCALSEIDIKEYPEFVFHFFNSKKLRDFYHRGNKLLPSPLVALLDMMKKKKYKHYLLMENDIVLSGIFRSFLKSVDKVDCDYMHIATDLLGLPESHWPIRYIQNIPFKDIHFSWSQMFYVSRKLLVNINFFMKENDTFYFEFLLPTMTYNGDYSVRQFENLGYSFQLSWRPPEVYEYKYQYERRFNTFYHPIKDLSIIQN